MKKALEEVERRSGRPGTGIEAAGTVPPGDCWGFFDKVYCVSLEERADRRQEAERQFRRVGLLERVEFALVKKHPTDCEQGIFESHMACIRTGVGAGAGTILVFEDDILFERFSPGRLRQCLGHLASLPEWNLLFLGCLVKSSRRTAHPNLLEVKYRSLAHAYAVRRGPAERLLGMPWQNVPFDALLSRFFEKGCYALYPSIAFQGDSRTDNTKNLRLDRFRRVLGGLQRIQKMNEMLHLHRGPFLVLHLVAALLVLLWTF